MKKYKLIFADPPWSFKNKKTGGSMASGAESHYGTMTSEEMEQMNIQSLTDENCLLAMWWVNSQPLEAIKLAQAWGFKVKTMQGFTWGKTAKSGDVAFGMGFYTRQATESVLFATKGKASELVKDHSVRNLILSERLKHSEKPQIFYNESVKLCGDVPRLELFARNNKDGWDAFGNECEDSIQIPCPCCNGKGLVEGDYINDLHPCLNCLSSGSQY